VDYCDSIKMQLGLLEAIVDKLVFVFSECQWNVGNTEKYQKVK
jgi:hypothetical protein